MSRVDTRATPHRALANLRISLRILAGILIVAGAPAAAQVDSEIPDPDPVEEEAGPGLQLGASAPVPPHVDPTTGALTLSVPIPIPQGPATATPDLRLRYASDRGHGRLGYGQDVPLGWVERSTRHGVPRFEGGHTGDFVLHLPEGSSDLALVGPGLYQGAIAALYAGTIVDPGGRAIDTTAVALTYCGPRGAEPWFPRCSV